MTDSILSLLFKAFGNTVVQDSGVEPLSSILGALAPPFSGHHIYHGPSSEEPAQSPYQDIS